MGYTKLKAKIISKSWDKKQKAKLFSTIAKCTPNALNMVDFLKWVYQIKIK